ncbi:chitin deacetylase, partial [Serendipita sp. 399]
MARTLATATISFILLSSSSRKLVGSAYAQDPTPYPSGEAYTWPPLGQISSTPDSYASNTLPVSSTYTAGATPTYAANVPPLPEVNLNIGSYPPMDQIPPTDSPEVQAWKAEINWDLIPKHDPTQTGDCAPGKPAYETRGPDGHCWWTCGQCVRDVDISTCANSMDYGHTYDDGPARYTTKLLTYLESKGHHATFFLIGSRILDRPEVVRYEYMTGHEIGVHTWSHARGLTTMTDDQVVAELGWTRKIIQDVIGVTPKLMRPPQGDIDDRVRAISLAMGMIPVLWSSRQDPDTGAEITWDSNDWRVHDGGNATTIQHDWEDVLGTTNTVFPDHGIVALQHDKAPET